MPLGQSYTYGCVNLDYFANNSHNTSISNYISDFNLFQTKFILNDSLADVSTNLIFNFTDEISTTISNIFKDDYILTDVNNNPVDVSRTIRYDADHDNIFEGNAHDFNNLHEPFQ